jgi:hypothetical protein
MRCGVVERWCSFTNTRRDLFGFIDIIAMDADNSRLIAVQSFGTDFQAHYRKITTEKRTDALLWLMSGGKLWLVGWRKLKRKNKDGNWSKSSYWTPRIYPMTLVDFETQTTQKGERNE